jgi:HK97 family phage major capsid protein
VNRYEHKKKATEEAMREHIAFIQDAYAEAKKDGNRELSDEQRLEVETHVKAIEVLKEEKGEIEENIRTLQRVDDLGHELGPAIGSVQVGSNGIDRYFGDLNRSVFPEAQKSIGEAFVDSQGYKAMVSMYRESGGRLPENYSSGPINVKGTLGETGGPVTGPTGGGALIPVPQVVPGVVEKLFQPLTIADLLLSGVAQSNSLRYVVEGTATSGAAGVAEGGTKPESAVGFTLTDEPIKKIATLLPVSEEMLEDGPAVQSYINGRLSLFVRIEEERQIFRGAGTNELVGLFGRSAPVYNYVAGTVDNKAVQLFKAFNSMRGSAFIEPEFAVMHPNDWQTLRLLTDTAGQFFGGGPFLGPYGGPQGPTAENSQLAGANDMAWSKRILVTPNVGGAGTALIGTTANAQVWRRGGLSVEASNSHASYFALNLVAIRAEERLGLAVYRPTGFVEVRFGTAVNIA